MKRLLHIVIGLGLLLGFSLQGSTQPQGRIVVEITENGRSAPGRFVVHGPGGEEVGRAVSGTPVRVAPGSYDVAMFLEGALDRPEKWVRGLAVGAGATARASGAFDTGTVEIRVTANGRRAAARIMVHRAGEDTDIATLGAGVPGVLSASTYDFKVVYRTQEKWLRGQRIERGSRSELSVEF